MGVRSTCTVVWLRGISAGNQKCHMHTYLYVMVINNKRQGHHFQNMEGSNCVDLLATYRLIYIYGVASAEARNGIWYGLDVTLYHLKYCGNSVIDGVVESLLSITID